MKEASELESLRNRVRRLEQKDEPNDGGQPMQCENMASRRTARGAMEDEIKQMRSRADRLETLLNALPAVLTPEADEALWSLLQGARRLY